MNWQDFEAQMRASVQGHQTPLDTDALWAALARKKKRRRILIFYWMLGTLGLVLSGVGALWYNSLGAEASKWPRASRSNTERPASSGLSEPTQVVSGSSLSPNPIQPASAPVNTPGQMLSITTQIEAKNTLAKTAQTQPDAPKKIIPNTSIKSAIPEIPANLILPSNTQDQGDQRQGRVALAFPVPTVALPPLSTQKEQVPAGILVQDLSFDVLVGLPHREQQGFAARPLPPLSFVQPQVAEALKKKVNKHSRQIGIEYAYQKWDILRNAGDSARYTRSNEYTLDIMSAGLHILQPVAKHWTVGLGVHYQSHCAVFRWDSSWTTVQERMVRNIYADGSVDTVFEGTTKYSVFRDVKHYNHIRSIVVPVRLQYAFEQQHGLRVSPFVELAPGYSFYSRGVIMGRTGQPISRYANIYTRRFTLGLQAGCMVQVPLSKKLSLSISPVLGADLLQRSIKEDGSERFIYGGGRLGFLYKI